MEEYSVGQVSKILKMPTETIRFLEKSGLVSPRRDEANGYRRYSFQDIQKLIDYRWYRDMGYTLPDAIDAVTSKDLFRMAEQMEQAELRALETARKSLLHAKRLKEIREKFSIEYLAANMDVCRIGRSPAIHYCPNAFLAADASSYKRASDQNGWLDIVLDYYGFMDYVVHAYFDAIVGGYSDLGETMGFAIEDEWAAELGLDLPNELMAIPSYDCVAALLRVPEGESVTAVVQAKIIPYLEQQRLSLVGDVWADRICVVEESGNVGAYFEVWAPVDK